MPIFQALLGAMSTYFSQTFSWHDETTDGAHLRRFQDTFAEAGYSVYERREVVEVFDFETEEERQAEKLRLEMNEITERFRDSFWRILDDGNHVRVAEFLQRVRASIEPVINAYR